MIETCYSPSAGLLFLFFLSYVPLLAIAPYIREHKWLILSTLILVITAHQLLSAWNFWHWPLKGAELDAYYFHRNAESGIVLGGEEHRPVFAVGTKLYEYFLYRIYSIFGSCLLAGQMATVLISSISCVAVLRMAQLLKINNRVLLVLLILFVGLMPSFLFYLSLTFREPLQLLPFILGVGLMLRAIEIKSIGLFLLAAVCFVAMGLFHHVLLAAAFVFMLLALLFYLFVNRSSLHYLFLKLVLITGILLVVGYWLTTSIPVGYGNDYVQILRENGGILEMISYYRHAIEKGDPGSSYGFSIGVDTTAHFLKGLIRSYMNYLFAPTIMDIRGYADLVAFTNAVWRSLAVLIILYLLIKYRFKLTWQFSYLSINFFLMSFLWSIGTTNYGQAFRHNVISDWLLAVILIYVLSLHLKYRKKV